MRRVFILCFVFPLLVCFVVGAFAQTSAQPSAKDSIKERSGSKIKDATKEHRDPSEKHAEKLIKKAKQIEDIIDPDYAEKKKNDILKKYPALEKDYLDFVRATYPNIESELKAIFKKYPEQLKESGHLDGKGDFKIGFDVLEKICLASKPCTKEVGDLLSVKYPDFSKKSVQWVVDNKPEIVMEFIAMTLEVLASKNKVTYTSSAVSSATGTVPLPAMSKETPPEKTPHKDTKK